jgi:hypothetical protein
MIASSLAVAAVILVVGDPPATCFSSTHDCLSEGEPGCTDASCCDTVCSLDPFCCTAAWDSVCVEEAGKFCVTGGECGISSHPCDVTGFPACDDALCCEAVCAVLPECCSTMWDSDCVLQAFALCRLPSPPTVCTTATHGCGEIGGPGCSADGCCADVCAVNVNCCAVAWDAACVALAGDLCGVTTPPFCDRGAPPNAVVEPELCGAIVNNGCNGGADSGSDCCVPSGGVDCDDPACVNTVCGIDPFCCMVAWDQICADESLLLCPETCAIANPQTTPIAIGVPVCGYIHTSPTSDYDWYALTLTEKTEVVVALTSTKPLTFGIGDADGVMNCSLAAELDPSATTSPSLPKSIDACLESGTHWIVVRPSVSTGVVTCSGGGEYILEVAQGTPTCDLPDPPNDICATAIDIFEGATPVSTRDAATEPSPAPRDCSDPRNDFPISRDVWFRFVAPRDGTLRVDTCGACAFAARLVAYSGTCEDLVLLACAESSPQCPLGDPGFNLEVMAGESYYLQLGGSYPAAEGNATISIGYYRCAAAYEPTVLVPNAPYESSKATSLSQDGQLVGSVGIGSTQYPMSWSPSTGLVVLSESSIIVVRDVNDAGLMVGSISNLPAVSSGSSFLQLPGLGSLCVQGSARAVNESGTIVGVMTQLGCPAAVVTWNGGVITPTNAPLAAKEPTAITESGTLAGWGATGFQFNTNKGWILKGSTFTWVEPPSTTMGLQFLGMNDAEELAGRLLVPFGSNNFKYTPVLWKRGVFTNVALPAGYNGGRVSDINNVGVACGAWDGTFGESARRGFVLAPNVHAVDLDLLVPTDLGYIVVDAVAINDAGQVAANLRLPGAPLSKTYAAVLTPSAPSGDLDCDGVVDAADLATLLGMWGPCQANLGCNADFTLDGVVDASDLAVLLGRWGDVPGR